MKKRFLLFVGFAFLIFNNHAQTVTDFDGNIYDTVKIGTQVWLKQNLKVTHYRNGDLIPNYADSALWNDANSGARCYYNNDSAANASVYGALYNWYTIIDNRYLCPLGWHVPSDAEWNILEKYLDNTVDTTATGWVGTDIGGKLKEAGTTHWSSPNIGATNSSGFTALPGGIRCGGGAYGGHWSLGSWWTAASNGTSFAWLRYMNYYYSQVEREYDYKIYGLGIRCIMDYTTQINEMSYKKDMKIYPNPAIDRVYIDFADRQNIKMQIYNVVGKCVLQRDLNNDKNEIDISTLTKGIYIVQMTSTDWTFNQKLIKE